MKYINQQYKAGLRVSNTAYSKINKSKEVWWFNVSVHKFTEDVHLLLNDNNQALWVVLPKGFTKGMPFKIREDKNAVDLEISSNKTFMYLKDVKSGGSNFSFKPYIKEKISF
ncbi:hypothetical protein [Urechidicola vernalis]|uniref:Uncharacterized protein n=1 Tax=Urechidicola vernalis TaxID=3075600 RepID=A0ABU2Y2S2_9FLAO|nr:hypothetical protein [Urechidicola sp. P050]MDT0552116.1 hypothetical protein [Urechidicola sp. P050]